MATHHTNQERSVAPARAAHHGSHHGGAHAGASARANTPRRAIALATLGLTATVGLLAATAASNHDTHQDERSRGSIERSPVHRAAQPPAQPGTPGTPGAPIRPSQADAPNAPAGGFPGGSFPGEYRTIDGTDNNPFHPEWGAVGTILRRALDADYADGTGAPAGEGRPSARAVSNLVAAQSASVPNPGELSDYLWQWGQFLDHDIDETPIGVPGEAFDIVVPTGDPWFDPKHAGDVVIPLDRSAAVTVDGIRQQLNNITTYIDASNVYGSEHARAAALRTLDGTGRLATSAGDMMPFNVLGFDNAPTSFDPSFFLAGDVRANEQVCLTAMHTLFVREHNYWADRIAAEHPEYDGDTIYEYARAIVGAEMQAITYNEWLPRFLGPDALPAYAGYDADLDPSISNVFATAAYRVGHTMLSPTLQRVGADLEPIDAGHLSLAGGFFTPSEVTDHGIDPYLRGLSRQMAQDVDPLVIDEVRNMLFGPPGSGGFDLASLNIQRGRDHGLPSYNAVRIGLGLPAKASFSDISEDPAIVAGLTKAYDSVDDIDAWVGLLAEPKVAGAMVGETLRIILADQFRRLRDGDRFWYETYLPADMATMVERQRLAVIIRRNTDITDEIQNDVFVVTDPCRADLDGDGMVGLDDLLEVLAIYGEADAGLCDMDGSGIADFGDVLYVLVRWGSC